MIVLYPKCTLLVNSLKVLLSAILCSKHTNLPKTYNFLSNFKNSKTSGIIYAYTPTLGWVTHFSNLSPVGPRSWRINFFITKIHTPPHFNTSNRSQTHLHHIPSPPTCKQHWSTPHSPWPTFTQHRYPLHNLTSNVNLLNLTFTDKAHLITQNTPILQLFKNFKTLGIIYTYTPTLGWVTHFSNLSPVGPRSWWINFFITKIQTTPHFNT